MALKVDHFVLERAKKAAKVARDVMILLEADESSPVGICYPSDTDAEPHLIYINPDLDSATANYVLFHELKHAAQEEAEELFSSYVYKQQLADAGLDPEMFMSKRPRDMTPEQQEAYANMPVEKEANDFARNYCDLYEVITG